MKATIFSYCQAHIEGNKKCKTQCDHCKQYYKPLEEQIESQEQLWNEHFGEIQAKDIKAEEERQAKAKQEAFEYVMKHGAY